ncbi:MAG: electron transfer flavoprotein subunit beta/FixA family protein [Tissierellales bacterium]|nr:electron transfer flavoprotein subunit beta/FixA family protein [Tissierellales bacterium]MBN2826668.1 electron transfer flavoprotein subunit beta/FixA family protein [Tissierellales bacterium]
MKIVVCIKQVPDTTEVKLDPKTGTLIREGVPSIINPDDKSGLETALQLKDKHGAHVTVLTMGPPQADVALKEALAMGADEAILLTDKVFAGADTWATSLTLAKAIENLEYDLLITGRQAIDGDTAQVGPELAEHLKLPHVSYVEALEKEGNSLILKRVFEDGYHKIKVQMPCLITALSEMNEPRYMSISGIYEAFREKQVKTMTFSDLNIAAEELGLKGSPTKVKKSFTKGAKTAGKLYTDLDAKEAAKVIVEKLKEKFII